MRWLLLAGLLLVAPLAAAEQRVGGGAEGFVPARILAGDWETIRWTWPANETHGVAPDDLGPAWCEPTSGGCETFFRRAGEYSYHCPLHPEMRGTIVIERPDASDGSALHAMFFYRAQGLAVTFDASRASQARAPIAGYSWDFGDNATGTGAIAEHAYERNGVYVVRLTVVDEDGNEDTTGRTVRVEAHGDPEAQFSATGESHAVLFEAAPIAGEHRWDFGDGSRATCDGACLGLTPDTVAAGPTSLVHVYRRGGSFTVNHTVGPYWGLATVSVGSMESFTITTDGLAVEVDASSLPRYGNATFSWLFGDLERATGERASHVFPTEGLWSIELTLADEAGNQTLEREIPLAPRAEPDEALVAAAVVPAQSAERPRETPGAVLLVLLALALAARRGSERYK